MDDSDVAGGRGRERCVDSLRSRDHGWKKEFREQMMTEKIGSELKLESLCGLASGRRSHHTSIVKKQM